MSEIQSINILQKFSLFEKQWAPHIIGELNGQYVKLCKLKDDFVWHSHENEDELFLVLSGHLRIEMETQSVALGEGELYVVPKGVRHNPVAENECLVMLVEQKSTLHTGNVISEKTRSLAEQLRPV